MLVNSKQCKEFITIAMKAKLVSMIHGSPGIGKSDIVKDIAKQFKLHLIDIRLSQCDPSDLQGFPHFDKDSSRATYMPMDLFPLEDTPIPLDCNGFLVFLDEANSAAMAVQAAAYKILLDKMVGQHKLHPKTVLVCAGNLATNGAIVNRMSTATQSRLVHLELSVDPEEWIKWASAHSLDHRVISYIHGCPDSLHKFDPKHNDHTFACPRTWEFVSDLCSITGSNLREILPLLAGTVGEGEANLFVAYTESTKRLPTIEQIRKNPEGALLDEDPAMLFAVAHMVAAYSKMSNIDVHMRYINRMPMEFATVTLKNALKRDRSLLAIDCVQDWIAKVGDEVFND